MKVYVVICGYDYEDTFVLGVYATKEKARRAIVEDKKDDCADWYDIAEWEVE